MKNIIFLYWAVIRYPSTLLHELAHAVMVLLTSGKLISFSTTPYSDEYGNITLGEVEFASRFKFLSIFVYFAPVLWWGVAVYLLIDMGLLYAGLNNGHLIIAVNLKYADWGISSMLSTYGIFMLFQAGCLSSADIKGAIKSMASVSGVLFCLLIVLSISYCIGKCQI